MLLYRTVDDELDIGNAFSTPILWGNSYKRVTLQARWFTTIYHWSFKMEFIKRFKFELMAFAVFSGLSVLYYLDTGEVKIFGVLVLSVCLLSGIIRLCNKLIAKVRVKSPNKNT